jgi:alkanesulfonate monooxygenase
MDIYWRIPTHGDKPALRLKMTRGDWTPTAAGNITPGLHNGEHDDFGYLDHMADIARAAEISGFYGALLPSFPNTEDPWIVSSALARETKTLRFMIAFQPGFLNPVHAARMSASLQRASDGRVVYNIISGGGGPGQLWWGDKIDHDDRYRRTTEFLDVHKGVWKESPFNYDGTFYQVENGRIPELLVREALPEIYFSGSSDAAVAAAGRHSDYYLSWLEPFEDLRAKFAQVRERTALLGREARFAVRVDVLARPTEEEAWNEIRRGWDAIDQKELEILYGRNGGGGGDSVGADRQRALRSDGAHSYKDLIIAPNIWSGFSLLRGGPGLGIVGDYANAAARLNDLIELGVDAFILAGVPHLEEAYRVGEEVVPLVRARHAEAPRLVSAEAVH